MKILDKLSRVLRSRAQPRRELESHVLDPFEIRLIAEGKLERLGDFAASIRLHAADPRGDTPLHLAARTGNLALCDLFIRSGADPDALNYEGQTPANVAFTEGHGLAAQLLYSLVAKSKTRERAEEGDIPPRPEKGTLSINAVSKDRFTSAVALPPVVGPFEQRSEEIAQTSATPNQLDDLEDLFSFDAADEPEQFFRKSVSETVSGTFVPLVSPVPVVSDHEDGDWDLDLLPAPITGEGIGTAAVTTDHAAEHDFLKVRKRGRQSVKRAVVQTGTRLSIDPETCIIWAEEVLAKGGCSFEDVDRMVVHCEGNGDFEELRINVQRNLEAAGFGFDQAYGDDAGLWDARSDVLSDDLADAIEAAFTRETRLPGTKRFDMDKADELQLLALMERAKQELQLEILANATALEQILLAAWNVLEGLRVPSSFTEKNVIRYLPYNHDSADFFAAVCTLEHWIITGSQMHGKSRREAMAALDMLDIATAFYAELVRMIEQQETGSDKSELLKYLVSVNMAATERLVLEHLPYVRRFAARSVAEGEDPEDVFQVAFMGLQRSTRRFDPERGYRFFVYASYLMQHAIMRWRADEGAAIRIPVHRKEKIARLDLALERLDVRADGIVSDSDLAVELEWTTDEVSQFRSIPRTAEYPESIDDWDEVLPEQEDANAFDQAENERIIIDALAELPEREADIIRMRFGIDRDSDMTLEEIGQIYGVTRERIRQIEAKGLDRLSHPGRKRRLHELLGYDSSRGLKGPSVQHTEKDGASETDNSKRQLMAWTRYRVARLEELWAAGMSASEIAEELGGTSRNGVIGKLSRLGLADSGREQRQ